MARENHQKKNTGAALEFEAQDGLDDISRVISTSIAATPERKPYVGRWETEGPGEPAVFLFGRGRDEA